MRLDMEKKKKPKLTKPLDFLTVVFLQVNTINKHSSKMSCGTPKDILIRERQIATLKANVSYYLSGVAPHLNPKVTSDLSKGRERLTRIENELSKINVYKIKTKELEYYNRILTIWFDTIMFLLGKVDMLPEYKAGRMRID